MLSNAHGSGRDQPPIPESKGAILNAIVDRTLVVRNKIKYHFTILDIYNN